MLAEVAEKREPQVNQSQDGKFAVDRKKEPAHADPVREIIETTATEDPKPIERGDTSQGERPIEPDPSSEPTAERAFVPSGEEAKPEVPLLSFSTSEWELIDQAAGIQKLGRAEFVHKAVERFASAVIEKARAASFAGQFAAGIDAGAPRLKRTIVDAVAAGKAAAAGREVAPNFKKGGK